MGPSSARSSQLDIVVRHFEKRIIWYRLPHGQECNTKLALVIGPVLESTLSLSSINQLNLADVCLFVYFFPKLINVEKKSKKIIKVKTCREFY